MTANRPIKVRLSLDKLRMAVLIKAVIIFTSLVRFAINFPECFLSTKSVSACINEANISVCTSFFTSSDTPIIITFAKYNDKPFRLKAKIINPGIK